MWPDNNGEHINAHGGGILIHKGIYYWFGEHKIEGRRGNSAQVGVSCYSSQDLYNWKNEGVALQVDPEGSGSEIEKGCILERPKVIYNEKTGKFVMWFHLEFKGKGYATARSGIAVADKPEGPYQYVKSVRSNPGIWPENLTETEAKANSESVKYFMRDFEEGQMERDMTLFVDDDRKAYHIYASEENQTLQIAELTDDYLSHSGRYIRVFISRSMEAPAMFKRNGKYYLIMSGCTGWDPNPARSAVASSIWGPWEELGNPCRGKGAKTTFESQSTHVLQMPGTDKYVYMGDRWRPRNPNDGRYIWLPIRFENEKPVLEWTDEWEWEEKQALLPEKQQVLEALYRVNNYWQETHPEHANAFWHPAAYHTGNMEAYFLTGEEKYRKYSEAWAEKNKWMGAQSKDKSKWLYSYRETDDYVLFGDWQICFQVYADLYNLAPDKKKIKRAREVMEYQMSTPRNDYWWWADGLYMVMPVMTKLYKITGNNLYLEKLHEYLEYAKSIMYDKEEGLFYRDAKYVYPEHTSVNGKKDFWARGDGWVFAGLAKVLQDLPETNKYRKEYMDLYWKMAKALKPLQQPEGYWTRSMMDPEHAPGPETSGTAFFAYGYLWGMNNGYLDKTEYEPVVCKAWDYLTRKALQEDGRLGYVQPIGERAIPGQVVDQNSTADFGVGAFLLASSEMVRYLEN